MSCPKPVELSRALIVGVDDQLRAHLEICTQCSEELDAHAAVAGATHQLPAVEPSHDHAQGVRAALMAAARTPAPVARRRVSWGFAFAGMLGAAAATAAVLMIVVDPPSAPTQTAATYRSEVLPHEGAALLRVGSGPDEIVRLVHGTVSVKVAKLEPGQRFRIVTRDAELDVADSAVDVSVDRDQLRSVRVIAGQVVVRAQGYQAKRIVAGERWEVELAHAEQAPSIDDAPAIDEAPVIEDDLVIDAPPVATAKKKHRPTKHTASKRTPPPQQLSASETPAPPAAPARPKRPIEMLFDEGWTMLNAGNPAGAAAVFEKAAQSAPKDPLAEDAWFWRASALASAKSPAAARALDQFLARYPSSPRVGEASAMLGWLVIDADLDRAEKLFKAASNDRVGRVQASAKKGLAAIEQRRKR